MDKTNKTVGSPDTRGVTTDHMTVENFSAQF